jgi:hypothetical protein
MYHQLEKPWNTAHVSRLLPAALTFLLIHRSEYHVTMAEGYQEVSTHITDQLSDPTVSHPSEQPPDPAAPVSTSEQLCNPTVPSHTLQQPTDLAVPVPTSEQLLDPATSSPTSEKPSDPADSVNTSENPP